MNGWESMTRHDILKGCNIFLKAIADAPALSCVEYYFIPWLREFTAVEALYPETIVSYAQAEEIIQRSSYASPQGIARVQEIAERYGIVTHEKCRYSGEPPKENELWLLRVDPSFFRGTQRAWREDHYVRLMTATDRQYYLVNAYPLEVREMDRQDMECLHGDCLVYRFRMENEVRVPFAWQQTQLPEAMPTISVMRDALLLYRVSLRRRKACLPSAALDELIAYADRLFFASAMAAKKNPYDKSLPSLWREDLVGAEEKFLENE